MVAGGSLAAAGGLGAGALGGGCSGSTNDRTVSRTTLALGTEVRITASHTSPETANHAMTAAFAELALVERLMSIYRPDSQISLFNTQGMLRQPHPYVVEVLRYAQHVSQLSGGAFDVTVQPLWDAFSQAAKTRQIPSPAAVAAALAQVDWKQLVVTDHELRTTQQGMQVTLNGIAQGFAADRVLFALRSNGIEQALIDTGELRPLGRSPRGEAWRVGIQHPRYPDAHIAITELEGRALATSGDYATRFSPDARHHHILDPRTGYSPTDLCSVSILAASAMTADALSTACLVLGPTRSLELIAKSPGVDAYFVLKDGETIATAGFPLSHDGRDA
jgi:thiamine biosynthesis lipoprotein